MSFKRIMGILLVICIGLTIIGAVSAEEISVGDVKFNIPDGFKENSKLSGTMPGDDIFEETIYKTYANGTDNITINVAKAKADVQKPHPMFEEEGKTINGHEGVYNETYQSFTYFEDGCLIMVCASNPDIFEQMLIKWGEY